MTHPSLAPRRVHHEPNVKAIGNVAPRTRGDWRAGVLFAASLACTVGTPPVAAWAQSPERGESPDSNAVRLVWSAIDATWNDRNAKQFSDLFAMDASFRFVERAESLEGRETIYRHFVERFPQIGPDIRHRTTVQEVRAIAPEVQLVDGTVEIVRRGTVDGTQPVVLRSFAIFSVMHRTADGWKIRALRVYQLPSL